MKPLFAVLSVFLTICCWGVYGPVLHWGQEAMNHTRLRPLICVGISYFIIAVVFPVLAITSGMEKSESWSFSGATWSLAAGAAGAIGAVGIILAFYFEGKPIWVMPLVFGGAPVINTVLTITVARQWGQVNSIFIAGLLLVGLGAVTVLVSKPKPTPAASATAAVAAQRATASERSSRSPSVPGGPAAAPPGTPSPDASPENDS